MLKKTTGVFDVAMITCISYCLAPPAPPTVTVLANDNLYFTFLAPLAPPTVTVLANQTSGSSVMLQWFYNSSATYVESWQISYHDNTGTLIQEIVPKRLAGQIIEATVSGLVSGFKYEMSVQSKVEHVLSDTVTIQAVTSKFTHTL